MLGSVWDRLLKPERYRQRVATSSGAPSVPMMMERDTEPKHAPFLVTNTRGTFIMSPRTKDGKGRYGFFECKVEDESKLLPVLYSTLMTMSRAPGMPAPSLTVAEAVARLKVPAAIVLAESLVTSICGDGFTAEQVSTLMRVQGHVAVVDGMQVLTGPLPQDSALVVVQPADLGVYTRVGDYLGIQLFDVRHAVALVRPNDLAG